MSVLSGKQTEAKTGPKWPKMYKKKGIPFWTVVWIEYLYWSTEVWQFEL